jgi:predicted transcriptional regulator
MTIDSALRRKVIELHLNEKQSRNQIAKSLELSQGSVSNILRAYYKTHGQVNSIQAPIETSTAIQETKVEPQTEPVNNNSIQRVEEPESGTTRDSKYTDANIIDSTGNLLSNTAAALPPHTNAASSPQNGSRLEPAPNSKHSGNPLQRFFTTEVLGDKDVVSTCTSAHPDLATLPEDVFGGPAESLDPEQKEVNIINDDVNILDNAEFENEPTAQNGEKRQGCHLNRFTDSTQTFVAENPQRGSSDFSAEIPATPATHQNSEPTTPSIAVVSESPTIEDTENIEDLDANWASRFWSRVVEERERRQYELLTIQNEKQGLQIERQQLAQLSQNLDSRQEHLQIKESKLVEIEQLAPFVKELQSYGITFDIILSFVTACHEKSAVQNMNMKDAAFEVAQIIRKFHDLEDIDRCIQQAEQRLKALDAFSAINNQAITTLINLQLAGYSEKEIMNLAGWNKQQQQQQQQQLQQTSLGRPGLSQGNGSSSHNGSSKTSDIKWDTQLSLRVEK